MDLSVSEVYPADLATAFSVITDPEAIVARYEGAGHTEVELLESAADLDGWVMRTSSVVTVELPGYAAKFLQPVNTVLQTHHWGPERDGVRAGTFEVETKGAPVQSGGTMRLEQLPDGTTRHSIDASLKVKVPLVGGKIEAWGKGDFQEQLDHELSFTKARLTTS